MLLNRITDILSNIGIVVPDVVITDVHRIGYVTEGKSRPICVKFISERRKYLAFEKSAELRKLGYEVDSDYSQKDRELRNKMLKARYSLRQQGRDPTKKGLNLLLDNRKLTEEDLDAIIANSQYDSDAGDDLEGQACAMAHKTYNKTIQDNKKT